MTDSVQVAPAVRLADPQVEAPLPRAKSSPGTPCVSTSTVLTLPGALALMLTVWRWTWCRPLRVEDKLRLRGQPGKQYESHGEGG